MTTINADQDYGSILFENDGSASSRNSGTQEFKNAKEQEGKNSIKQEVKNSRKQELNGISSAIQENKKSRIVTDAEGNTRRPANIMMRDDVKMALDVMAAHRRVRVWTLIDQALKEFLERENQDTK